MFHTIVYLRGWRTFFASGAGLYIFRAPFTIENCVEMPGRTISPFKG